MKIILKLMNITALISMVGVLSIFNIGCAILCLLSIITIVYLKKGKIQIDKQAIILIVFSISYSIFFAYIEGGEFDSALKYLLFPFLFYELGYTVLEKTNWKESNKLILYFAVGLTIFGILGTFKMSVQNLYHGVDFFTEQLIQPVNLNAGNSLIVSLLYYGIFYTSHSKREKVFIIVCNIIAIYTTIIVARRTVIATLIIIFLINIIIFQKNRNKIYWLLLGGVCFLSFIIIYKANIGGVKGFIDSLPILERITKNKLSLSNDVRFSMWKCYFPQCFSMPFSGSKIHNPYSQWAHNFLLDVYIKGGLQSTVLLILYLYQKIKSTILLYFQREIDMSYKCFYVSVNIGLICLYIVSPVYEAYFYMFAIGCLVDGVVNRFLREIKMEEIYAQKNNISIKMPATKRNIFKKTSKNTN